MTRILWLAILALLSASQIAFAGKEGGNGGDTLLPDSTSAWFLQSFMDRRISACFVRGKNFSLPDEVVKKALYEAAYRWGIYTGYKGIFHSMVAPSPIIEFQSNDLSDCTGERDLVFYLGTFTGKTGDMIENARKQYTNPIAFAYRTAFDKKTSWGKGFVWVAPDNFVSGATHFSKWSEDSFEGIISHEMGHILGCEHISGTIMREDILNFLNETQVGLHPRGFLHKIDQERELILHDATYDRLMAVFGDDGIYRVHQDAFTKSGAPQVGWASGLYYGWLDPQKSDENQTIKHFWGQNFKEGKLHIRVKRLSFGDHWEFNITLTDGKDFKEYSVHTPLNPILTPSEGKVFKTAYGNSYKDWAGGTSEIFNGLIDEKYTVIIQRNSITPASPLAIWWSDGVQNFLMFSVDPNEMIYQIDYSYN